MLQKALAIVSALSAALILLLSTMQYSNAQICDSIQRNRPVKSKKVFLINKTCIDHGNVHEKGSLANIIRYIAQLGGPSALVIFTPARNGYPLLRNISVPSNVSVMITPGAVLKIADTITLTMLGPFDAALHQVFDCAGTGKVIFGKKSVAAVSPEWFGAVPDGSADSTVAIIKAFKAAGALNHVQYNRGTYNFSRRSVPAADIVHARYVQCSSMKGAVCATTLKIAGPIGFDTSGMEKFFIENLKFVFTDSFLGPSDSASGLLRFLYNMSERSLARASCVYRNLSFTGDVAATDGTERYPIAITENTLSSGIFENIEFRNIAGGIYIYSGRNFKIDNVRAENFQTCIYVKANKAVASKALVIGREYRIDSYAANDDFLNVGGENATGKTFIATGPYPAVWENGSTLTETCTNFSVSNIYGKNTLPQSDTWIGKTCSAPVLQKGMDLFLCESSCSSYSLFNLYCEGPIERCVYSQGSGVSASKLRVKNGSGFKFVGIGAILSKNINVSDIEFIVDQDLSDFGSKTCLRALYIYWVDGIQISNIKVTNNNFDFANCLIDFRRHSENVLIENLDIDYVRDSVVDVIMNKYPEQEDYIIIKNLILKDSILGVSHAGPGLFNDLISFNTKGAAEAALLSYAAENVRLQNIEFEGDRRSFSIPLDCPFIDGLYYE